MGGETVRFWDIELDFGKIRRSCYVLPPKVAQYLQGYLAPGETIHLALRGTWDPVNTEPEFVGVGGILAKTFRAGGPPDRRAWFVLTNQRVILVSKGLFKTDFRDFGYGAIEAMGYEQGVLTDRFSIHSAGSTQHFYFPSTGFDNVKPVSHKVPGIIARFAGRAIPLPGWMDAVRE